VQRKPSVYRRTRYREQIGRKIAAYWLGLFDAKTVIGVWR
jgi:hypothetical protein